MRGNSLTSQKRLSFSIQIVFFFLIVPSQKENNNNPNTTKYISRKKKKSYQRKRKQRFLKTIIGQKTSLILPLQRRLTHEDGDKPTMDLSATKSSKLERYFMMGHIEGPSNGPLCFLGPLIQNKRN